MKTNQEMVDAVREGIDALSNWLMDNVPDGENWEDAAPEIDNTRNHLLEIEKYLLEWFGVRATIITKSQEARS
ncbi:MAG: hypothetical protein AB7F96_22170 [Beijerinckiaceae bacterium]